ncbi:hypothetical protein ACFQSB_09910 [Sphaerisporangium rhizosphaerae]|uniref:Uncharacterized protein n=2 Tax=Sphaerisporangium rhizosphaerae TaxID=2269375 RepID=A0ABW2NYN8_9ACTN
MLTFHVQNQAHESLWEFPDDAQNSFLNLCRRLAARAGSVVDPVDPYADTMFNFKQLDRLLIELDGADEGGEMSVEESLIAAQVKAAAQYARQISGYLFIQGD